jgi:hypothetical protein
MYFAMLSSNICSNFFSSTSTFILILILLIITFFSSSVGSRTFALSDIRNHLHSLYFHLLPAEWRGRGPTGAASASALSSLSSKDLPFSEARLSQARTVIEYAPTLVEKVRDGFPLNEASPFGFDLHVITAKLVLHVSPKPGRVRRSLFDRRHDRLALPDQRSSKLDVGAKKITPIDRAHGVSHVVGLGLRAAQNVIDVDL